jgi:Cu+-exporting ATPase
MLHNQLPGELMQQAVKDYEEIAGKGIKGHIGSYTISVGNAEFTNSPKNPNPGTYIYININGIPKGYFKNTNIYRPGVEEVFKKIKKAYKITILSGDNEGEKAYLEKILPEDTDLLFKQNPHDKLQYVKQLQQKGENVMMIGDGLNDAGALMQSNVGIAISEDINVFSPANDGILEAKLFNKLPGFLKLSQKTIGVVKRAFLFSFIYNSIGLYFAVTAQLTPIIAAILMPISSISVVIFVTLATNYWAYRYK